LSANVGYNRGNFSPLEYGPVAGGGTGRVLAADVVYPARTDQMFTAGLALIYRPKLWLSVSLAYNFEAFNRMVSISIVALIFLSNQHRRFTSLTTLTTALRFNSRSAFNA
jgi:hypothetical protein